MNNQHPPAWGVLKWNRRPRITGDPLPLTCEECGGVADMPCGRLDGGAVTAILPGNRMVLTPWSFQPPRNFLPDRVQCPHCGEVYKFEEPRRETK